MRTACAPAILALPARLAADATLGISCAATRKVHLQSLLCCTTWSDATGQRRTRLSALRELVDAFSTLAFTTRALHEVCLRDACRCVASGTCFAHAHAHTCASPQAVVCAGRDRLQRQPAGPLRAGRSGRLLCGLPGDRDRRGHRGSCARAHKPVQSVGAVASRGHPGLAWRTGPARRAHAGVGQWVTTQPARVNAGARQKSRLTGTSLTYQLAAHSTGIPFCCQPAAAPGARGAAAAGPAGLGTPPGACRGRRR